MRACGNPVAALPSRISAAYRAKRLYVAADANLKYTANMSHRDSGLLRRLFRLPLLAAGPFSV